MLQIGASAFAGMSRVKAAELSKYASQADDRTMPIDVLLDAELVAGNPIVSRLLVEMQGFRIVPIEVEGDATGGAATIADVLHAVKETGDIASAWIAAHADGHCDALDRRELHREIDEAITALLALRKGI